MAFFSSPSLPKLPLSWGTFRFPRTGWAPGDSHPMSSGVHQCVCGRFWDCPTSWVLSRRKLGGSPPAMPQKGRGG